jgi:hypothetical protein
MYQRYISFSCGMTLHQPTHRTAREEIKEYRQNCPYISLLFQHHHQGRLRIKMPTCGEIVPHGRMNFKGWPEAVQYRQGAGAI